MIRRGLGNLITITLLAIALLVAARNWNTVEGALGVLGFSFEQAPPPPPQSFPTLTEAEAALSGVRLCQETMVKMAQSDLSQTLWGAVTYGVMSEGEVQLEACTEPPEVDLNEGSVQINLQYPSLSTTVAKFTATGDLLSDLTGQTDERIVRCISAMQAYACQRFGQWLADRTQVDIEFETQRKLTELGFDQIFITWTGNPQVTCPSPGVTR